MSVTKYNISKQEARRLYTTIKDLHDILWSNDILYWVTGGTLLGAIRHRGIVPWDDDGDICMMSYDVPKLKKLIPVFEKKGYTIYERQTEEGSDTEEEEENNEVAERKALCMKRGKKHSCTWYLEPNGSHSLGVDIFMMERVGPLITYADPYWRTASNGGKTCWFWYKYTFPLVPVVFGNFWVMTPFLAVEHLNQCYGTDWSSMSQRLFDHRSGKWIDSEKKRMLTNDYATIPPPTSTCQREPPALKVKWCRKRAKPAKNVEDLTVGEVKMIARALRIPNRSKTSVSGLRRMISTMT